MEENCNPNIGGPNSGDLPKKVHSFILLIKEYLVRPIIDIV